MKYDLRAISCMGFTENEARELLEALTAEEKRELLQFLEDMEKAGEP